MRKEEEEPLNESTWPLAICNIPFFFGLSLAAPWLRLLRWLPLRCWSSSPTTAAGEKPQWPVNFLWGARAFAGSALLSGQGAHDQMLLLDVTSLARQFSELLLLLRLADKTNGQKENVSKAVISRRLKRQPEKGSL